MSHLKCANGYRSSTPPVLQLRITLRGLIRKCCRSVTAISIRRHEGPRGRSCSSSLYDPSLPFGPEQSQWRLPRCNGHLCGNVGRQVLDLCGRSRRGARISPISALGLCLNRCCRPRAAIRCLATEARITASAMTARREASGWGWWRVSGAKRLRSRNRNRGLSHAASRPSGGKRVRSRAGLAMLRMC